MFLKNSLFILIAAGLMNGSFAIPARYIQKLSLDSIWLLFTVAGLLILPWLFAFVIFSGKLHFYLSLTQAQILFLSVMGILFGIGQICFAYAIRYVGIALSFAINLGIAVIIGSMFVIVFRQLTLTYQGLLTMIAILLIIAALVFSYFNRKSMQFMEVPHEHSRYVTGWLLAAFAGITSGLQNITFILLAFQTTKFQIINSFWVWPPFLLAASVPMIIMFLIKMQPQIFSQLKHGLTSIKSIMLTTSMGLCFTGSLVLYSYAMNIMTPQQQIIGWPLFMLAIILSSQCWGFVYREVNLSSKQSMCYALLSIACMSLAIVLLAFK